MPKVSREGRMPKAQPLTAIATLSNRKTRMVHYQEIAFSGANPDGSVRPILHPGPFLQKHPKPRRSHRSLTKIGNSQNATKTSSAPAIKSRSGKGLQLLQDTNDDNAEVQPHVLCAVCQLIVSKSHLLNGQYDKVKVTSSPPGPLQRDERLEIFQHYASYGEFMASCRMQCHLCILLWDILDDEIPENVQEVVLRSKKSIYVQIGAGKDDGSLIRMRIALQAKPGRRIEDNHCRCVEVERTPSTADDEEERDTQGVAHNDAQLSISTASNASFELAKGWLEGCLLDHISCRAIQR